MSTKQNKPFVLDVQPGDYHWCACGESAKQPFCDGSHKESGTGLRSVKYLATESKTLAFCGCKQTASAPFCDGTHGGI